MVKTALAATLALALCLFGCGNKNQNNDAIKQGVLKGVAGKGVNVDAMNVDVTSVTYRGNQADATVVFTPKSGPAGGGLTMHYTLDQHDGTWVIVGRGVGDMQAHTGGATQAPAPSAQPASPTGGMGMGSPSPIPDLPQTLPQGHPQTNSPGSTTQLPPGHPALPATGSSSNAQPGSPQ